MCDIGFEFNDNVMFETLNVECYLFASRLERVSSVSNIELFN